MNNPYVSIIMPCYNSGKFVESAILSILNQPEQYCELIIVDDGSTDNTGGVCEKYQGDIVHYYKTENLGAGHARNYGLTKAKGHWVSYMDSDDLYLLGAFDQGLLSKLKNYYQQGYDIIYTPACYSDMNLKNKIDIWNPESEINTIPQLAFWTCFYNRQYLLEKQIRFYEYRRQDIETAFRYLTFSKTDNICVDSDIRFYLQRNNLESNTHTWHRQTLHEVKAQIYYDLYINHSFEETKKELLSVVLSEIENYYIACKREGIEDIDVLRFMSGFSKKVMKKERQLCCQIWCLKDYVKLYGRIIFANINKKNFFQTEEKSKEIMNQENSEVIIERLKIVSKFLLGK